MHRRSRSEGRNIKTEAIWRRSHQDAVIDSSSCEAAALQHDTWRLYVTGSLTGTSPPSDIQSVINITSEACRNVTVGVGRSYLVDVKTPNTNRPLGWSVSSKNILSVKGKHTCAHADTYTWVIPSANSLHPISPHPADFEIAKKWWMHGLITAHADRRRGLMS